MKGSGYPGSSGGLNCKGELLNRILGGVASPVDQRAFEMHIETCESCRLSQQLCGDFARIAAAPNDSARIARIAAAALSQRRREAVISFLVPEKKRKPIFRFALVALAICGTAAAAAVLTPWFQKEGSSEPVEEPANSKVPSSSPAGVLKNKERGAAQLGTETDEAIGLPATSDKPAAAAQPPTKATESVVRKIRPSLTAESIFREGNLARRNGNSQLAIKLYRQLQGQFMGSPEANLSRVSLGRLLLQSGSSKAAVAQFDAYLGSGPSQSLAAEALYGRAQALQALGRSSDETENWRRLVKSYPNSPYSAEARRRLQTLR